MTLRCVLCRRVLKSAAATTETPDGRILAYGPVCARSEAGPHEKPLGIVLQGMVQPDPQRSARARLAAAKRYANPLQGQLFPVEQVAAC